MIKRSTIYLHVREHLTFKINLMKRNIIKSVPDSLVQELPKQLHMSFYIHGISNTIPEDSPVSFQQVIDMVRSSERLKELTEQYRTTKNPELKKSLPYVTASGIFSKRDENGLLMPSSLFCVDIDKVPEGVAFHPETGEEIDMVELIKYNIMHDDNIICLAAMRSPSGNGVKVFVWHPAPVNLPPVQAYQEIHKALDSYIDVRHTLKYGASVDKQCFDISRATFLCHDPLVLTRKAKI